MFHEEIFKMQLNSLLKRNQQTSFLDKSILKERTGWGICFLVQFSCCCFLSHLYLVYKSVLPIFITFTLLHFFHAVMPLSSSSIPYRLHPQGRSCGCQWDIKDLHLFHFISSSLSFLLFSGSLWPSFTTIIIFQPHISF